MSFNRIISAAERAKPQTAMIYSIEKLFGHEIRYLAYYGGGSFEWVSDPCDSYVLKYDADQLDEAADDIAVHGGELVSFPHRGTDVKLPDWRGHNAASRLEYHFEIVEGANLQAAE